MLPFKIEAGNASVCVIYQYFINDPSTNTEITLNMKKYSSLVFHFLVIKYIFSTELVPLIPLMLNNISVHVLSYNNLASYKQTKMNERKSQATMVPHKNMIGLLH